MKCRARTIESCYNFDAWNLVFCAMPKHAPTSACVTSRVPSVDINAHAYKRVSLNVTWRCVGVCVLSPNWFKTTSRGGFCGTRSI